MVPTNVTAVYEESVGRRAGEKTQSCIVKNALSSIVCTGRVSGGVSPEGLRTYSPLLHYLLLQAAGRNPAAVVPCPFNPPYKRNTFIAAWPPQTDDLSPGHGRLQMAAPWSS